MNCRYCNRELTNAAAIAKGIGPICEKKEKAAGVAGPAAKITFLSKPTTTRYEQRSWLYRIQGEPSSLVRVYPDPEGDGRTATCDCPIGKQKKRCIHIDAVGKADAGRFLQVEVKN